jgi:molybdate transport system permease protein
VQAFDDASAWTMSLVLLAVSLVTIALTYAASRRIGRRLG